MALAKAQPVLIEAMTYRGGHHRCETSPPSHCHAPRISGSRRRRPAAASNPPPLPPPLPLSTSDDSTRYRDAHELKSWNETNNVTWWRRRR